MEQWYKIWCPDCKKPNWVCNGDPSDMTAFDINAVECFACHKVFPICEDMDDIDKDNEEFSELGRENPN